MIRIINEETKKKRVARYREFDNGHVIHGDWKDMSSDEAEDMARQMSIKNPNDIYYVKYDDIMDPDSDLRWINGKSYHYSEVGIRSGKPYIKGKSKVTESDIKFLPVRGNKSIRTIVWNKNSLSSMSLYRISRKYGIEISPVNNSYSSIWMKTNKNNIENLFLAFAEINDNYTVDEIKEIYNSEYLKSESKVTETVGESKYFTKPFADAIKSKFNIDMTGKTSEEFEWVKPFVNSEIIVKVGRRSDGNYYIICHFKDDNYNYVNALVGSNEISKFKKILSKI